MTDQVYHGRTFEQWKREANAEAVSLVGVSLDDLPDQPYWDYWSSGYSPSDAAREVLEQEADEMGFDLELD